MPSDENLRRVAECLFGEGLVADVLITAFNHGLSRLKTWDLSGLPQSQMRAYCLAAKVYKRGVEVIGLNTQTEIVPSDGGYHIEFKDNIESVVGGIGPRDQVVIDQNVFNFWWHRFPCMPIVVDSTEETKTLDGAETLNNHIFQRSPNRVVVIGGGVLEDMVGFLCGLHGVPCVYVPTTLLSMADSSVGGKTGVNFPPFGKNQLGLFAAPSKVLISTDWLSSLEERELKSGLVECLKHALLAGDENLWKALVEIGRHRNWGSLLSLLPGIVKIKADIVGRDPFEQGERAALNFGHTLGHAFETLSYELGPKTALRHGEAVALGMIYALKLSKRHSGFANAERYADDLKDAGVVPVLDWNPVSHITRIQELLSGDKKNGNQPGIEFVLLNGPGAVSRELNTAGKWTKTISAEDIVKVMTS